MLRPNLRRVLALATAAASLAACGGSSDSTRPKSITLSLSTSTTTLTQGQSGTVTLTIGRTNFSGDVTLSASGLPNGVTAAFNPATVSGSASTSTLTLTAAAGATVGASTVTITAQGTGVDSQTGTVALTVNPAGSFTIALSAATLSVQQGANGTATITVTRAGGMSGDVALTATGLPTGVTAGFNPATVGGAASTSTLTLTAASNATVGTGNVTIKGSSSGFTDQTATLSLTVTQAASGTRMSLTFCATDVPSWAAYQNEGGAWTQATLTNGTLEFNATGSKVGVAAAYSDASGSEVDVIYLTTTELAAISNVACAIRSGTKTVNGSVSGLGTQQRALVNFGDSFTDVTSNTTFQFTKVADGAFDLVATRETLDQTLGTITPDKVIVRRGLNIVDGGTIPELPFGGSEAVPLTPATITVANLGQDQGFGLATLLTASGTTAGLGANLVANGTLPIYGIPATLQLPSDLYAYQAQAGTLGGTAVRVAAVFAKTFGNTTVTLGPAISSPTVTVAGTTPYVRVRTQVAKQAEYGDFFVASVTQDIGGKDFSVVMSASYLGTSTTWDVTFPDLSSAAGWSNAWAPSAGVPTDWSVGAIGANFNPYLSPPGDGSSEYFAFQNSASSITPTRLPSSRMLLPGVSPIRVMPGMRGIAPRLLLDRSPRR